MAEWPFHRANQKLVVRLDWLFLASLSKILGLGEGRLKNESSTDNLCPLSVSIFPKYSIKVDFPAPGGPDNPTVESL